MAVNSRGPYELRIPYTYSGDGFPHVFHFNCIVVGSAAPTPGTPAADIDLVTRSSVVDLDTAANQLWTALRPKVANDCLAPGYELWNIPTGGGDPIFVTAGDLDVPNGSGGLANPSHHSIFTFRSANGGIGKIVVMDVPIATNTSVPIPSDDALGLYAIGADSFLIARDDGFFVARMKVSSSQNERLYKARNRR